MTEIDPNRYDLVEAFNANPNGPHSSELQRLVNKLRFEPTMKGKYAVVTTKPYAEWTLCQLPGERGKPIVMLDQVFTSLDDAERAIFKLRWEAHTGVSLDQGRGSDNA